MFKYNSLRFTRDTTRRNCSAIGFPLVGVSRESGVAKDVGKMAGELKDVPKEFQVWSVFPFPILSSFFFVANRAAPFHVQQQHVPG